jgi:DNA polymerase
MTMRILSIDIETYSSRDLTKCGVYAYTEAEDFEILLFGYAFDKNPVSVIDLKSGEKLPRVVMAALTSEDIIKTAFNASFERTCIAAYFKMDMLPEQWRCSAVHALSLGLPQSLEGVAKSLNLVAQKSSEGKALIKYFSIPCFGSCANGFRNRNLPFEAVDKWDSFKGYCAQDVEVEREIRSHLEKHQIPESEQTLWCLDQRINDRGVKMETDIIKHALACNEKYQERLKLEAIALTGVKNPNSAAQMKKWLFEKDGLEVESLSKEMVAKLLKEVKNTEVGRALELRQELSKTSIKKYEAMHRALCKDNRIRGLLKFYGANRTGRWSGTLVQVQNLPRNKLKDLDLARALLMKGQYETIELLFSSVPEVLSQLIRTTFIPSIGSRFIVADFSAIEARVIAWLADEKWRMEVFNSHGKIYEASAAQMFKVPIDAVTKDSAYRQKGKISELALGYQGGTGALIAMGALNMGLSNQELPKLVSAFRNSNQNIVKLWGSVEKAAISVVRDNITVTIQKGIRLYIDSGILFIKLPSGRRLSYVKPRLELDERFNKPMVTYEGLNQVTKQWGRLSTYGGKLVENIVQAIARDCLGTSMTRLSEAGYNIVMHVHDEVVLDVPYGFGSLQETSEIMGTPIAWAKGLPLRADVFETNYYKKD